MLWSLLIVSVIALCNTHLFTPNGTTSQSSDYEKLNSASALDGNKNRCSHTKELPDSWWRIDLLAVYNISSFSVYNMEHHNSDITNASIHIGNSCENSGTTNSVTASQSSNKELGITLHVLQPCLGATSLFFPSSKPLILSEVMMSGTKQESPFLLVREEKTPWSTVGTETWTWPPSLTKTTRPGPSWKAGMPTLPTCGGASTTPASWSSGSGSMIIA